MADDRTRLLRPDNSLGAPTAAYAELRTLDPSIGAYEDVGVDRVREAPRPPLTPTMHRLLLNPRTTPCASCIRFDQLVHRWCVLDGLEVCRRGRSDAIPRALAVAGGDSPVGTLDARRPATESVVDN